MGEKMQRSGSGSIGATIRKVDVHHHFLRPDDLRGEATKVRHNHMTQRERLLAWSPEQSLEVMEAHAIDFAIGSISTPGVWFGDAAEAKDLARQWNDYAIEQTVAYPKRFGFFATVPLPATDVCLAEIERTFRLGAAGVALFSNYDGLYPGDPKFDPVLQELDQRRAVVYVHPTAPAYGQTLPGLLPQVIEFAFETTRAVTSLLISGVTVRYPNISWIFSHSGGAMPMLADRMARLLENDSNRGHFPDGLRAEIRKLHFDVAGASSRIAIAALREVVPISRILYGSDFPFVYPASGISSLEGAGFTVEELHGLYRGNAMRILNLNALS